MRQTKTQGERRNGVTGWRIQGMPPPDGRTPAQDTDEARQDWQAVCDRAADQGYDAVCVPAEWFAAVDANSRSRCRDAFRNAGLALIVDETLPPHAAAFGKPEVARTALDTLLTGLEPAAVLLRTRANLEPDTWSDVLARLRERHPDMLITVWTPGMTPAQWAALEPLDIDGVYSSLPWWNYRDTWLVDEYERLRAIAPIIAPVADHRAEPAAPSAAQDALRRLATATVAGDGVLVPQGWAPPEQLKSALHDIGRPPYGATAGKGPRSLTGPLSDVTALLRADYGGRLLLINRDGSRERALARGVIERRLPHGLVLESPDPGPFRLAPDDWSFVPLARADHIVEHGTTSSQLRRRLSAALRSPRIAIEAVRPAVDGGAFAVKRTLGQAVVVQADIFMDGHDELAAEVLWRPADESDWTRQPMKALGNDLWEAGIVPRRLGRYVYTIRAWLDRWASFCAQLRKKSEAGVDVSLEVEEGRRLLAEFLGDAEGEPADAVRVIEAALERIGEPSDGGSMPRRRRPRSTAGARPSAGSAGAAVIPPATAGHVLALLDPELMQAVRQVEAPAFETTAAVHYPLHIERNEASFASWYELFPRSQSPVPGRHGTLRDVIERLPAIRRMGFDVLYFPPIHPIGRTNRKGRNNSLQADPDDPGSPYAIGSADGGHDAVHPELGTLDDFRALVEAARRHGMEIALDFAIQCSPDHPWLREHPDWFNWRVDGTLKYAENPPKRYEDIVNPDFYSPLASTPRQAALWRALRDVVLFWVHQGVHIFRVDNPHTKPLPFWQWLLQEVHERYPDTIFLSEAFTRPAMMYRLAKIGFSQSYTYFTWRNTKYELTQYMTELNRAPVRDIFRPNFFVNTPDINPWFLQSSGRAGFLIRAVLAGTLSGSWGLYNGFELCVSAAVPGKEEYLDSEKYELRHWDRDAPGNIVDEITRLNRIRRNHPALQSHLGVRFHSADNDQVLFYSRHSEEGDSIVIVAVSLDPHHRQTARLHLARHDWGVGEGRAVPLHDLFEDHRFLLHGASHDLVLTPERPFVLWAVVRDSGGQP